jgi:GTP-dependent phosphoenolpyruvate carboxykinase
MRRMISTVMAISVLIGMVGLISPTYAQLNLSVWQDLREKEDKFSNTTFIWEAEVFSESNPTALPDEVLGRIRTQGGIVPPLKTIQIREDSKVDYPSHSFSRNSQW